MPAAARVDSGIEIALHGGTRWTVSFLRSMWASSTAFAVGTAPRPIRRPSDQPRRLGPTCFFLPLSRLCGRRAGLFNSPLSPCGRGAGGEGLRRARAPREEVPRCRSRSAWSQSLRRDEDGSADSVPVRGAAIDRSRPYLCSPLPLFGKDSRPIYFRSSINPCSSPQLYFSPFHLIIRSTSLPRSEAVSSGERSWKNALAVTMSGRL